MIAAIFVKYYYTTGSSSGCSTYTLFSCSPLGEKCGIGLSRRSFILKHRRPLQHLRIIAVKIQHRAPVFFFHQKAVNEISWKLAALHPNVNNDNTDSCTQENNNSDDTCHYIDNSHDHSNNRLIQLIMVSRTHGNIWKISNKSIKIDIKPLSSRPGRFDKNWQTLKHLSWWRR